MKWFVLFDNPRGKLPKDWVLSDLIRFTNKISAKTLVDVIILSENQLSSVKIFSDQKFQEVSVKQQPLSSDTYNGAVISLTAQGVDNLLKNEKVWSEFSKLINLLEKDAPLIFSSPGPAFEALKSSGKIQSFNIIYQKKIGIRWFNYHLENLVIQKLI